jgi:hypothetical protein
MLEVTKFIPIELSKIQDKGFQSSKRKQTNNQPVCPSAPGDKLAVEPYRPRMDDTVKVLKDKKQKNKQKQKTCQQLFSDK